MEDDLKWNILLTTGRILSIYEINKGYTQAKINFKITTRLIYYYVTANVGDFMLKLAMWLKLYHSFLEIHFSMF